VLVTAPVDPESVGQVAVCSSIIASIKRFLLPMGENRSYNLAEYPAGECAARDAGEAAMPGMMDGRTGQAGTLR
jgi:hypothetical protein